METNFRPIYSPTPSPATHHHLVSPAPQNRLKRHHLPTSPSSPKTLAVHLRVPASRPRAVSNQFIPRCRPISPPSSSPSRLSISSVAPGIRPNLIVQPRLPRGLAKRWWTPGGLCWARRSRRWWRVSLSASSAAATRSSASRRRAGGRRAPTRSSSASACAPPSVCSRRWGPSPRTPYRRPASPSAASLNSTPAPTPARAPSASTSTRCPTGTTSASRGARASASSSPQPSCNGHLATVLRSLDTVLLCFYPCRLRTSDFDNRHLCISRNWSE